MIKGSSDYAKNLAIRVENAELRNDPETNTVASKDGYQLFFLAQINANQKKLIRYHVDEDEFYALDSSDTKFERIYSRVAPALDKPFTIRDILRDAHWSETISRSVIGRVQNATAEQLASVAVGIVLTTVLPHALPYAGLAATKTVVLWKAAVTSAAAAGSAAAKISAGIGAARMTAATAATVGVCVLYEVFDARPARRAHSA